MSVKFVLVALFLVAASASTPFKYNQDHKEEVEAFAKGFLKGISSDPIFDNIKTCLADTTDFITEIATAIKLIETKDPVKVKQGIILLGKAVQILPDAARACQASETDIAKLIALAKSFSNPQSFVYHVAKSLLINRVEVLHEVNSAVAAYYSQDYFTLGYWVGKAMDTIFLGMNRTLRPEFNNFINSVQSSFVAGEIPEKFRGLTLAQIKARFLGAFADEDEINVFNYETEEANGDIPTSFDSAKEWPGCVHPIRDQGHCGSCWAFAASEVLSDRFCIASKSEIKTVLSPQYLVSCDNTDLGCNGGYPVHAWKFIINNGLVTDSCFPYASHDGSVPKCNTFTKCSDGSAIKKFYGAKNSLVQLSNPTSVQKEILAHGPVEAAFSVYEDFLSYKSGVYKHTSGSLLGGHAVKVVGWGVEGGVNYWLVSNSWGPAWGINGQFKIAFGQCGIDKAVTAVQADVSKTKVSAQWF